MLNIFINIAESIEKDNLAHLIWRNCLRHHIFFKNHEWITWTACFAEFPPHNSICSLLYYNLLQNRCKSTTGSRQRKITNNALIIRVEWGGSISAGRFTDSRLEENAKKIGSITRQPFTHKLRNNSFMSHWKQQKSIYFKIFFDFWWLNYEWLRRVHRMVW